MILGVGNDLLQIQRFKKTLERFGDRALDKFFTPFERNQGLEKPHLRQGSYFAKRFAAKEAFLKALGTGMREGLSWQDIEIRPTPLGQPQIFLNGGALSQFTALVPQDKTGYIHLSLSDDADLATAVVILSAS